MKLHLWNHLQNNIHPFVWLFCVLSSSVILGATEWGQNFLTFIVIIKIFDDGYVSSRSAVSNDNQINFYLSVLDTAPPQTKPGSSLHAVMCLPVASTAANMSGQERIRSSLQQQLLGEPEKIVQTFMSSHFSLQMLCLQKVITYHWIQFRKIHCLSYGNFRNILLIMGYRNKNLHVLVLFLYQNASRAAPASSRSFASISRGGREADWGTSWNEAGKPLAWRRTQTAKSNIQSFSFLEYFNLFDCTWKIQEVILL